MLLKRYLAVLCCFFFYSHLSAQQPSKASISKDTKELPPPTNLVVLDEHKDAKGNTIRKIRYDQAGERVTETITIPPRESVNVRIAINPDTLIKDSVLVIVNKAHYNVEVFYRKRMIRSYKAVFGPHPLENKKMAGDRCTPEGWFTIRNKNPNSKYWKFMLLDYPNDSSIARFNKLKQSGMLPQTASIGGDVGIHGIWKGGDDMIEMGVCWTDGCIALKNKDIDELYRMVGVGTKVCIRK